MVDTVLQFEGDQSRIPHIAVFENRFGSTAEIGIYEMLGSGLREVSNPSEILISHKDEELSGTYCQHARRHATLNDRNSSVSTAVYGRRNAVLLQDIMQKTEYDSSCSEKSGI
jgi:DNA repair protein RadA/Sms